MDEIDEALFYKSIFDSLSLEQRKGLNISSAEDMTNPVTINNQKFTKISIKHQIPEYDILIELVPIKYYICETPKSEIRAVLYSLACHKTNNKKFETTTEETEIFYYISDGYTNSLRANMLYPFWCLNDINSGGEDCPFNTTFLSDWGLFKLAIFKNLDLKIIDKIVFDKTVEDVREIIKNMDMYILKNEYTDLEYFYPKATTLNQLLEIDSNKKITVDIVNTLNKFLENHSKKKKAVDTIVDKIVKDELYKLSHAGNYNQEINTIDSNNPSMDYMSTGIRSVLRRVQNILDLLIAIINENITNFDERNIDKYRPNYDNPTEKYNMEIDGTLDNIKEKRPIDNIYYTEYNIIEIFRKNLLNELKKLVSGIKDLGIIECEEIRLNPIMINGKDFNKALKVCTGSEGKYKEYFENKMKIYESISKNIQNVFLEKICLHNSHILKSIIINFEVLKLRETSYSHGVFRPELSRCKQKYLKYKTKYLELKKKLII